MMQYESFYSNSTPMIVPPDFQIGGLKTLLNVHRLEANIDLEFSFAVQSMVLLITVAFVLAYMPN